MTLTFNSALIAGDSVVRGVKAANCALVSVTAYALALALAEAKEGATGIKKTTRERLIARWFADKSRATGYELLQVGFAFAETFPRGLFLKSADMTHAIDATTRWIVKRHDSIESLRAACGLATREDRDEVSATDKAFSVFQKLDYTGKETVLRRIIAALTPALRDKAATMLVTSAKVNALAIAKRATMPAAQRKAEIKAQAVALKIANARVERKNADAKRKANALYTKHVKAA